MARRTAPEMSMRCKNPLMYLALSWLLAVAPGCQPEWHATFVNAMREPLRIDVRPAGCNSNAPPVALVARVGTASSVRLPSYRFAYYVHDDDGRLLYCQKEIDLTEPEVSGKYRRPPRHLQNLVSGGSTRDISGFRIVICANGRITLARLSPPDSLPFHVIDNSDGSMSLPEVQH